MKIKALFITGFLFLFFTAQKAFCQHASKINRDKHFFNGKNLTGWHATDMDYWFVRKGVIIGHSDKPIQKNEFLWSDVEVKDFYLSVDVLLEPGDRNAGIQFRSRKADESGQAKGYQADVGQGVWGKLYHEHGRAQLDWTDRGEKAVKPGQWNHYEILAVGHRIWTAINGTLSVAVEDVGGELSGYIAFQIHSGLPQTVKYRINKLIHDPPVSLIGLTQAQLEEKLQAPLNRVKGSSLIDFKTGDVVVFAGGTNMANMRYDGFLETMIVAQNPAAGIRFRNLAWEGDTSYEQFRDVGFGKWAENINSAGATIVFVQFGQMESLQGPEALSPFITAYKALLKGIQAKDRQIVLISPIPTQPPRTSISGQEELRYQLQNQHIEKYAYQIKNLAQSEGYIYIDLVSQKDKFTSIGRYTSNGIHLTQEGQKLAASLIMKQLKLYREYDASLEPLRRQILKKNELWFEYWRPSNWAFLNGDRTSQAFSHDWQNKNHRIFPEEIKAYEPFIEEAEKNIALEAKKLIMH